VAEQIFRHATCPVMTVGPEVHNGLSAGTIRAILYATDFSSGSRHAFAYALSLAKSAKAKLILLHAIENDLLISFGDQAFSIVKSRLGQLMPEDGGVDYSVVAECGPATDMILKTAKDVVLI
jgi:nucleotide-binding universal stress UspA family protein